MTVFVPEGTGDKFVKIVGFFVDNTCQALLADQFESSDMAAGFGKRSRKNKKLKKLPNIHKKAKIL